MVDTLDREIETLDVRQNEVRHRRRLNAFPATSVMVGLDEVNRWVDRTKLNPMSKGLRAQGFDGFDREAGARGRSGECDLDSDGRFRKKCQKTVAQKSGLFVRFEGLRSEKHKQKYVPLITYQGYKAIGTCTRPWQRLMMFLASTRREESRSDAPRHRCTARQKQT